MTATTSATSAPAVEAEGFPYRLTRLGVVMAPEEGNAHEAEGVLNPGSGRTPDGRLHLLPRLAREPLDGAVVQLIRDAEGGAAFGDERQALTPLALAVRNDLPHPFRAVREQF